MKKQQSGFTLIELIAVIVVLGILGAVAIPRFVDMSAAAETAAAKGVAGALASASALNYAAGIANAAGVEDAPTPVAVADCAAIGDLLDGGLPTDYAITGTLPDCTVAKTDGGSADFVGHAVSL